jgi:hypothetical protein
VRQVCNREQGKRFSINNNSDVLQGCKERKMKRFLVLVGVCLLTTSFASAAPTVTVGRLPGTFFTPGWTGEYQLTPNAELGALLSSSSSFQSFCIERGAYVQAEPATTYNVGVSDKIMNSGVPLAPETAYLYTQFHNGTLTGYDYTVGADRADSARSLQAAIWYTQGQGSNLVDLLNPNPAWTPVDAGSDEAVLAQQFVDEAMGAGWTSIGNVRVLNLSSGENGACVDNQDMLGVVPTAIPVPGALAMVSIGVGLLGWRRKRSAS